MSRYQDTVIDDDEESCPLCIEEFDLSDKNFKPCPCGYQICQFCFNSLKTTYEKSTCPNCRRPYDESTIQYKIPTAEELKMDQLNKNKKMAAAKRKETEKREVESSSRRNLAGVRVKQQNLVYVIGLEPTKKDEASLMETLRGRDFFGQYGPIEKIVVSKPKPGAVNQGVGVYVTFRNKEDAATCIACVDGSANGDKILRAQYGTTKYCSTFLRGEVCQNKNCSFLHETGEDGQSSSLQGEPIEPKPRPPTRSQPTPQPQTVSQPMAREGSREGATSRQGSIDGSALPPTAGWANAPVARARRASMAASNSTSSPQLTHATLALKKTESVKQPEPQEDEPSPSTSKSSLDSSPIPSPKPEGAVLTIYESIFEQLKSAINNSACIFRFDDSSLSEDTRAIIAAMPPLIDPYGGAKRRIMQDKQAEARAKLEADEKIRQEEQAKSAAEDAMDEENMAAGSLALGGEPEENPRSASARGTIGRPSQQNPPPNLPIDQMSNLNLNRSLTPQQRQQLAMLNAGSSAAGRLPQPPSQNTAFEMSDFERRGPQYSQAQYDQISGHGRHGSRYFNNEAKSNNARFTSQQQQSFFSSGIQGPPPGLPTAGTPPISGGGMFAHGQGFTSSGFGTSKDSENLRTRSGTNAGHDVKRGGVEHLAADPSILSARIHQGTGGQGLFGGNQGEEDYPPLPKSLAPQSAVHSRVSSFQSSQGGRAGTPKVPPGFERLRSSSERVTTPQVPPGFEELHAHPSRADSAAEESSPKKEAAATVTVPMVPVIPTLQRSRKSSLIIDGKAKDTKSANQQDSLDTEENAQIEDADDATVVPEKLAESRGIISGKILGRHVKKEPLLKESKLAGMKEDENIPGSINPVGMSPVDDFQSREKEESVSMDIVDSVAQSPSGGEDGKSMNSIVRTHHDTDLDKDEVVETPAVLSRANTPPFKRPAETKRPTLRTLNITSEMIARSESQSQAPPSTTTEKSTAFPTLAQIRQSSRQPSVSVSTNVSRPSTPAASERLMSQDVSRAGSPPPGGSVVGSAPARQKTKNQLKKERKEKAKKTTDMSETGSVTAAPTVPTPPTQEEVGPIVARQKKQKKQKTTGKVETQARSTTEIIAKDETPREEENPPEVEQVGQDASKEAAQPDIEEFEEPAPESPSTPPPQTELAAIVEPDMVQAYTLRDYYNDAHKIEARYDAGEVTGTEEDKRKEIQDLLVSQVSPLQKLLSEMIASGDLSKEHPLFSSPPFSSAGYKLQPDNRKGQAYLDGNGYTSSDVFGMVYLPHKEKRALYNGHAVSVADSGDRRDDLLRRCLITPNGAVLRHLSREEGEKVLDLEERRSLYVEEYGDLGRMDGLGRLEDEDYINLEGGFEELSRFGERHGICWVVADHDRSAPGKRTRYVRTSSGNGLEDDYGVTDMPVDADDYDDQDQFDDADEDEDDEDELEGEEMVLGADAHVDEDDYAVDEDLALDTVRGGAMSSMNLPSLPDMVNMNMPGSWDPHFNPSYPARGMSHQIQHPQQHSMYSSLGPASYNSATNAADLDLPPPPPLPLPPPTTAPQSSRNPNTLPPMRHQHTQGSKDSTINLRALTLEQLEKRVKEKQREIEVARRDAEKAEKVLNKKVKDAGRWREGVFRAVSQSVAG